MSDPTLTVEAHIPDALQAAVADKLTRAKDEDVAGRISREDATLWGPEDTPEIANRLGWLTIAERMLGEADELTAFANGAAASGLHDVVLLGMGGSSLAPEVLRRCFGHRPDRPRLHVLDSTDAATVRAVEQTIDLQRTFFLVSSKSGGTIEPLSLFAHFWSVVGQGSNFAAITDPGSGLEKLASEHGFRKVFAGDPNIGGRYSALSAFGMVPGALMGVDVQALLRGSKGAWLTAIAEDDTQLPAAIWLGAALSALAQAGRDKLTFVVASSLPSIGLWLEQLVAESTGKHGTGILPVADEPLARPRCLRRRPRVGLSAGHPHARPRARSQGAGARTGRPPCVRDPDHGAHRPRPRVPARRARRRGRRLGPSDQPVRSAQRAAGEGCDQPRARRL